MNRLNSEGTLYFSNNYRGFELDEELEALYDVEEITSETIGLDFKRNQKFIVPENKKHPTTLKLKTSHHFVLNRMVASNYQFKILSIYIIYRKESISNKSYYFYLKSRYL